MVVAPGNASQAEEFFQGMGIKSMTGHHYLRGYIGYREAEGMWLAEKITGWVESVETLSRVSHKHLKSAYAGLQKSLQQDWAFVQRFTPGIGDAFGPVEKGLRETFVTALFEGLRDGVPERGVTRCTNSHYCLSDFCSPAYADCGCLQETRRGSPLTPPTP